MRQLKGRDPRSGMNGTKTAPKLDFITQSSPVSSRAENSVPQNPQNHFVTKREESRYRDSDAIAENSLVRVFARHLFPGAENVVKVSEDASHLLDQFFTQLDELSGGSSTRYICDLMKIVRDRRDLDEDGYLEALAELAGLAALRSSYTQAQRLAAVQIDLARLFLDIGRTEEAYILLRETSRTLHTGHRAYNGNGSHATFMGAEKKISLQPVEHVGKLVGQHVENDQLTHAFDEIIRELRADKTKKQPTKLEQMLEIFRGQRDLRQPVLLDDLAPLFEGTYNPRQAASHLLIKLNSKLEKYGFHIGPMPGYHITALDKD